MTVQQETFPEEEMEDDIMGRIHSGRMKLPSFAGWSGSLRGFSIFGQSSVLVRAQYWS